MDSADRLGELIEDRREQLQLSASRAARLAKVSRGTWQGIEKAARETESYNFAPVEGVLGWKAGSIKKVLAGDDPELLGADEYATVLRSIAATARPPDRQWVERRLQAMGAEEGADQGGWASSYWDEELGEIADVEERRIWDRRRKSVSWRRGMIYLLRDDRGEQDTREYRRRAAG